MITNLKVEKKIAYYFGIVGFLIAVIGLGLNNHYFIKSDEKSDQSLDLQKKADPTTIK